MNCNNIKNNVLNNDLDNDILTACPNINYNTNNNYLNYIPSNTGLNPNLFFTNTSPRDNNNSVLTMGDNDFNFMPIPELPSL